MLGAPAVTVKLQLEPDLRIEMRCGQKKYKSVVKLDPEAAGISENERANIFAAFTGRRQSRLNKLSAAKKARAIIMHALCDNTGGESALEALLATKLASHELDENGDLTTVVRRPLCCLQRKTGDDLSEYEKAACLACAAKDARMSSMCHTPFRPASSSLFSVSVGRRARMASVAIVSP